MKQQATNNSRLVEVQYLRALAALSVVVYHASVYLAMEKGETSFVQALGSNFGLFGVTLFFVISGFLMARLAPGAAPVRFLLHRVARIYPIFWLVATVAFFMPIAGNLGLEFDPSAFLLIPGGPHRYVLGIEWTLPFELGFYVVVFALISLRLDHRIPTIAVAWLMVLLFVQHAFPHWMGYTNGAQFPTIAYLLFSERCYGFVLGLLIPWALRRANFGAPAVAAGILLIGLGAIWNAYINLLFAAGSALLVSAAATPKAARRLTVNALATWGDWSFALYLVHVPVMLLVLQNAPPVWPALLCWIVAVCASLVVAAGVGWGDIHLYHWLRARCDAAPTAVKLSICGIFLTSFIGLGADVELETRQDRREIEAAATIGHAVEQMTLSNDESLSANMASAGYVQSENLAGNLEAVVSQIDFNKQYSVDVVGWSLDRGRENAHLVVLFFGRGRYIGSAMPKYPRPDVAAHFTRPKLESIGFARRFLTTSCFGRAEFAAMIVSNGQFALADLQPQAFICKEGAP